MKKCPYCSEDIQNAAIKCKHCGSMLDGSQPQLNVKINEINPFAEYQAEIKKNPGKISVLGYAGMALGILSFVGGLATGQIYMTGFGIFLVFGSFMWARRKPKL